MWTHFCSGHHSTCLKLLMVLLAGGATAGHASADPTTSAWHPPATHVLRAHVVDDATGHGVAGAWVEIETADIRIGADSAGTFSVELEPGSHRLMVHALGYESQQLDIELVADTTIVVRLQARPVLLEEISVQVDRLTRRNRPLPWLVRNVTRDDLLASAAATPVDVLAERSLQLMQCPNGELCVRWRNRAVRPVVCIDERPAFGGLDELRTYPFASLYLIEVHDRGRMVRAYTTWYMERVAEGRMSIQRQLPARMAC